jgi:hypothetical protein
MRMPGWLDETGASSDWERSGVQMWGGERKGVEGYRRVWDVDAGLA